MFESFAESARRVLALAGAEANLLSHGAIGAEHILLGLIREGDGVAAKAMASVGISLDMARSQVMEIEIVGLGDRRHDRDVPLSPAAKAVCEAATQRALRLGHPKVETEHLLLAVIGEGDGNSSSGTVIGMLERMGIDAEGVRQQVLQLRSGSQADDDFPKLTLDSSVRNLTDEARRGRLDPSFGREREIARVLQILGRRERSCPVVVGDSRLGTQVVLDGLAQRMVQGKAHDFLRDAELLYIELGSITPEIMTSLTTAGGSYILGVRGLPIGSTRSIRLSADPKIPDVVRQGVIDGRLRALFVATTDEHMRAMQDDPDFASALDSVVVEEPDVDLAVGMMQVARDRYEIHHRVIISNEALTASVHLASRYIEDSYLPESAFELIDDAASHARVRRLDRPPNLLEYDARIAEIRDRKETAIDHRDFDSASRLRDDEKKEIHARAEHEKELVRRDRGEELEIDESAVIEVVSGRTGRPASEISRFLISVLADGLLRNTIAQDYSAFKLLNDVPIREAGLDLLGMHDTARDIASLLASAPAPFILAIDASWGMGKSSLLQQIEDYLPGKPSVYTTSFNAWTAQGENALEALIKSVLQELDPNVLRRSMRRISEKRHLMIVGKVAAAMVTRFLGVPRIVDGLWSALGGDDAARNELRGAIHSMLSDWVSQAGTNDGRTLVVFVDDLDRCSDDVVVQVCEAVKLYLDAPGLIFVMACDMSVLARGVGGAARGGAGEGRTYLEKIVQLAYRLPAPAVVDVEALIRGYARESGTSGLLTQPIIKILVERGGGNPRRIKRLLNSFVLENRLNSAWSEPPLNYEHLISVIIVQHLYPEFFSWVAGERAGEDPIGDFLDYVSFNRRSRNTAGVGDRWWSDTTRLFRRRGLVPPQRRTDNLQMQDFIDSIDGTFPSSFADLAKDEAFVALLGALGGSTVRRAVCAQLVRRRMQNAAGIDPDQSASNVSSDPATEDDQ